ncbi:guanitoxin biosynthesis heme-dependent pre-guanitoxin N-hydroxylase GntA [Methylobacterium sp. JK268]
MIYPVDDSDHPLTARFKDFVRRPVFPCVGAKSALGRGQLRVVVAGDLACGRDDDRLYPALLAFVARCRAAPGLFQSFAVVFAGPTALTEEAFERHLWTRLQALSDRDSRTGLPYDHRVRADPDDPHFGLSLGGEAFFVVGLHPGASRPARRFEVPVLVFNLRDQFERLRAEGRYEGLRAAILERDRAWTGSINPMLARHGEASEARQYSGRLVGEGWTCPFRRREAETQADPAQIVQDLRGGAFLAPAADGEDPRP